jgi:hypothetical protein
VKTLTLLATMSTLALTAGLPQAAERIHAGLWETTIESGGRSQVVKQCVTPAEAAERNGDEKSLRVSAAKAIGQTDCEYQIKVAGNQVVTTTVCHDKKTTSTTTYHGDSYEHESSNGRKVHARRVGAC